MVTPMLVIMVVMMVMPLITTPSQIRTVGIITGVIGVGLIVVRRVN